MSTSWINLYAQGLADLCPVSVDMYAWLDRIEQEALARRQGAQSSQAALPTVLPQPDPEQRKAALEAAEAEQRIGQKERDIYEGPAVKRAQCGQGGSTHKRKVMKDGTVRDRLARFYCGRSDCPFCWRGRLVHTLNRATRPLLYHGPARIRCGKLWTISIPTERWESLNRSLRRLHEESGRLRLDRTDGTTLVFCDHPIPDGVEVSPAEAVDKVLDTVERLHPDKNTFRLLGAWSRAKKGAGWKIIHRIEECFDYELVARELADMRKNPRFVHGLPGVRYMLEWRSPSIEEADRVWRELLLRCGFTVSQPGNPPCHFSANRDSWPESDTSAGDPSPPPADPPFTLFDPQERESFPWI